MKKISLICALLMFKPLVVYAESGSCAPLDENGNEIGSCKWTLEGDTLTFSGKGPIKDYGTIKQGPYNTNTTDAPWNDKDGNYATGSLYQIRNVIVEDGITSVGKHVMSGAFQVDNVIIGDGVKTIGQSAFYACGIDNLTLGKNVETLEYDAFHSNNISNLVLPESLKEIGIYALWGVVDSEMVLPESVEKVAIGLPMHKLQTLYCAPSQAEFCQQVVEAIKNNKELNERSPNFSYKTYTKAHTPDGDRYIIDGVRYKSVEDFHKGKPVKLIYTVEEAMEATKNGTRFHVGLTYK